MNAKTVSVALVAVMVGAVMFGALFPIFDDVTATEDTYTNAGYYDLRYTETDDITLIWDYTEPYQVTVNNEVVPLNTTLPGPETIICGDNWFLRYLGTAVQFYGPIGSSFTASVEDNTSMSVVASNGSATATNTAETPSTRTVSYTYIYCVSNNGNLVMKDSNEVAYLNADSPIYAMGTSTVSGAILGLLTTGTIEDGLNTTVFRGSGTYTATPTITPTQDAGHIDLYTLDSIAIAITGDVTGTATYTYFMVPAEVTAERAVHVTDSEGAIMDLIPLIIGLGLVLMTVAFFLRKKL